MTASDDLADLLVPHWTQGAPPRPTLGVPGQPASYGQGVLASWNPTTFENTVYFHGSVLENLPVMAGPDALTFRPGDVVGIMYWSPQGGSGQYWILPRIIVPGTDAAEKAVEFMQTALAQRLSLEVIRSRFHHQVGENAHVSSRNAFDDPDEGSPRPVISNVEIVTGVAVVWLSGQFANLNYPVDPNGVGELVMGVEVSGATSRSPSHEQAVSIGRRYSGGDTRPSGRIGSTVIFDDLNPGVHTFTAKYMVTSTLNSGFVLAPRMVVLGM